jgi:flagellar biosynthesis protein FliR
VTGALWAQLGPHLIAVALIASRLVPVAFLCPLLGGAQAPTPVKLSVVLALSLFLHLEADVAPGVAALGAARAAGLALQEAVLGTAVGLLASLPFDVARMGGRFSDLFRGSSAEAALPLAGTREAAAGEALSHLLVAVAAAGPLAPLLVGAVLRSYRWAPLGRTPLSGDMGLEVARLVGGAFSTALALGAPVAAASLAIDTALGLAARAAPGVSLQEVSAPVKILGGAAVLWLGLGVLADRLQALLLDTPGTLQAFLGLGGGSP